MKKPVEFSVTLRSALSHNGMTRVEYSLRGKDNTVEEHAVTCTLDYLDVRIAELVAQFKGVRLSSKPDPIRPEDSDPANDRVDVTVRPIGRAPAGFRQWDEKRHVHPYPVQVPA